ncbi:MAG TPA: hypothetical protein VKD72_36020 [Gemmataceae bacterium]|nr:hypothetical protein [Gemmataceae bacterium]
MPAPVDEADLPPFSNLRAVCARCARRERAYVIFDRDWRPSARRPLSSPLHGLRARVAHCARIAL